MASAFLKQTKLEFKNASSNTGEIAFNSDAMFESDRTMKLAQGLIASNVEVTNGTGFVVTTKFSELTSDTYYLDDGSDNKVTITSPDSITSYTLKLPAAQGSSNTYLKNDGSGNLSWSTVTPDIPKLIYALQGALVDHSTGSGGSLFPLHSVHSLTTGDYAITKQELDSESIMSNGVFTVPSGKSGWYRIHGMFFHPYYNMDGTAGQNGLGDYRIALRFSTQNDDLQSMKDTATGTPDTSTINAVRYLEAGSTFSFRYYGSSQVNEDFQVSVSIIRYS